MRVRNIVITVVAVALVASATFVLAGPGGRGPGGPHEPGMKGQPGPLGPLARGLDHLDLTTEQKAKVEAIVGEQQPALEALREQVRAGREAFEAAHPPTTFDEAALRAHLAEQSRLHTEMVVLQAQVRAKVLAVLTPEQLAELEAMRQRHQGRMEGPRHGRGGMGF